jgi:hypothetical protein
MQLLIQLTECLRHLVDVSPQCAQLVAINDIDAMGEMTGGNLLELSFDLLDGTDQRPGDGIAKGESKQNAAERESNNDLLRFFVNLPAGFDTN